MPNITIREVDLTSPGATEVTTITAYVPGYAVTGPINTPTLCETLSDFQTLFGANPYLFRKPQPWPVNFSSNAVDAATMGNFAEAGDMEKSYVYAAELLRQGMPVLFERVFNKDQVENWSASAFIKWVDAEGKAQGNAIELTATYPGSVSANLYYMLSVYGEDSGLTNTYALAIGRNADGLFGTSELSPVTTIFTFDKNVSDEYSTVKYYKDLFNETDNSGLVKFNFLLGANIPVLATSPEEAVFTLSADTSQDEFTVQEMYSYLSDTGAGIGYDRLTDRGEYVLKFITTGAYPVFEYNSNNIANLVITTAANRGDSTALIDHTPNNARELTGNTSVYNAVKKYASTTLVNSLGESAFTYAAMFSPYGVYNCTSVAKNLEMPASFGYLLAAAASSAANNNWLAVAGVTRGGIPNLLKPSQNITNAIAEEYQNDNSVSINPITNIRPYGYIIWGNRTLKNNALKGGLTATSFLNIRQLANDVKRTVFVAAKRLTFEQNSDILWINFKSEIIPLLDSMVSGNGLSGYKITKQNTTKKATIKAKITLYAIEAIENWDITVELADSEVTVSE